LLAGVLVLGWLPLTAYWIQKSYPTWSPDPEQTANVTNALQINKDAREYRPRWAPELQDSELLQAQRKTDAGAAKAEIDEGEGTVTASEWRPRNISLLVNSESGVTVKLSQFYYPGWVAQIAGTSYYLDVVPSRPDGLLRIAVPKGDHRVLVQLSKTRPEYIGEIISLVSVLIVTVLVLAVFSGRIRRTLVLLS